MDPALCEMFTGDESEEVSAIIRLKPHSSPPDSVRIVSQFGDIATCRLKRRDIKAVHNDEKVISLKAPRTMNLSFYPEDLSNVTSHQKPYRVERPDVPETGRGTLIGMIDWGCDFAHPDFLDDQGATRIKAIWMQRGEASDTEDNPYGRGRIILSEAINQALQSDDPYQFLGLHPGEIAPDGGAHGTHTMGIAAGNGKGSGVSGMAPDAEIVFVQADSSGLDGLANFGDSVALLEAIDFIVKQAGSKPVVINISMGRHGGPHDGTTLVELAIDEKLRSTPGLAIVNSAGNYYLSRTHSSGSLTSGQTRRLEWQIDPADNTRNELEIWYPGEDNFQVTLIAPSGETIGPVTQDNSKDIFIHDELVGRVYHRSNDPNNQKNHIDVFLYENSPTGHWQVEIESLTSANGRFDAWIERDSVDRHSQSRFAEKDADTSATIGTIANGHLTITVGAYDGNSKEKRIAPFSSKGPTIDNRTKPDLVAPGINVLAARSAPLHNGDSALITTMSGTSMAAPQVTGSVALMFEAAKTPLSIYETRQALLDHLYPDTYQLDEPNRIGKGFLNSKDAIDSVRSQSIQEALMSSATPRERQPSGDNYYASGTTSEELNSHIEPSDSNREKTMWSELEQSPAPETASQSESDYSTQVALDSTTTEIEGLENEHLAMSEAILFEESFADTMPDLNTRETAAGRRLRANEVKYLVLEGGGGKGLVYLGALRALERIPANRSGAILRYSQNRLQNIRGVAGSSAGAITAMALSIGMNASQIERRTSPQYQDFDEFFDMPSLPRKLPALGRNACVNASQPSQFRRHTFGQFQRILEATIRRHFSRISTFVDPRDLTLQLTRALENYLFQRATQDIRPGDNLNEKLFSPALLYYAQNLWDDQGLFSGCRARRFLDQLISSRPGGRSNMTFRQHFHTFRVKLKVTGSNLETGRTEIFSVDTTPNMAVADAVRISMGLPVIFKPIRINRAQAQQITNGASHASHYQGVWVDGGLWNNLPMTIFNREEQNQAQTLGLALGTDAFRRTPVNSIGDLFTTLISRFNGDEALTNTSPGYRDQVITLDTGQLSTTNFSPSPSLLRPLQRAATRRVTAYFSQTP